MVNWTEEQVAALSTPTGHRQPAKGRLPSGRMNKTESMYAAHLEVQRKYGDVTWWGFEAIKVRIGKRCFLEPDFLVFYQDGHLEIHDTKGRKGKTFYAEEDAIVKARAVGNGFPIPIYFVFREKAGEWAKVEM